MKSIPSESPGNVGGVAAAVTRRTIPPSAVSRRRLHGSGSPIGPGAFSWVTLLGWLALAPSVSAASPAAEQNWPAWRGPLATGVAPHGNPPTTWSETKHVKWKVKVAGKGTATPIVWGNQVFLQTAIPTGKPATAAAEKTAGEPAAPAANAGPPGPRSGAAAPTEAYQFTLLCLDRQTGRTLWQKVARDEVPHEGHHPDHGFASHSPVTDGQRVFAWFGSRGLHCYDLEGNLKWSKDFGRMKIKNAFGEGSSPALFGETLVLNWDHEGEDFIVALNAATGEERWRQPRDEETSWATPLIVQHEGRAQVVTSATRKIRSYDLATGQPVWECAGMTANVIPSPVSADGVVYATSGFRGNALLAIRLGRSGDLAGTDALVWSLSKNTPYVPSPLLVEERLYFYSANNAVLTCCDARTGRVLLDAEKLADLQGVYSSPVAAAGRVYLVGRNGASVVLRRSDQLEVLATNRLDDKFDASPAIAGKELFLRGRESLYCLAEP
jgi:outer membrane protein assembly factor BamB